MTAAEVVTVLLSSVALFASLFTLGWQLVKARWERPVIVVQGQLGFRIDLDGEESDLIDYHMWLNVFNVGERPSTIIDWGWIFEFDEEFMDEPTDILNSVHKSMPKLPLRLDPHDRVAFNMTHDLRSVAGKTLVPFVRVVQRPTWLERRRDMQVDRSVMGRPCEVLRWNDAG